MRKMLGNKKGLSLIEVLVSITVLGAIIIPLTALFADSLLTVKYASDRIIASAVVRTVKENVSSSVKFGIDIPRYDPTNPSATVNLKTEIDPAKTNNLKVVNVVDGMPKVNSEYKFDVERTSGVGTATSIPGCPNTCEYIITIRKIPNDTYVIQRFKLLVNLLD